MLTKRQRIMFIFFVIYFAFTLFSAALSLNIDVVLSNLAVLLFLAALYLERNINSRFIIVLASAMMIVSFIFSLGSRIMMMSTPIVMIELVIDILFYVSVYFFALSFYQRSFFIKKRNMMIIFLLVPQIGYTLYHITLALIESSIFIQFYGTLNFMHMILSYLLSGLTVAAAIITYISLVEKFD